MLTRAITAVRASILAARKLTTELDEVRAGGSYNSTNDTRLHFGLGDGRLFRNDAEARAPPVAEMCQNLICCERLG